MRRNRLLLGYLIGASTVASGIAFVVLTSAKVAAQEEEEKAVEVALVKEPEPEPEPEPPPPPPELKQHHISNPGPRLPKLEVPTTISNDKVAEKDVKPSSAGSGDPYEKGSGDGSTGPATSAVGPVAPPPPPPPPKVRKPRPVSEDDTPPERIGDAPMPVFPAEAAGIDGTVLVRFVVPETGEVTDVKAVKGPPELFAACVAAVKQMRFKPAHDAQGNAISVVKYQSFRRNIR